MAQGDLFSRSARRRADARLAAEYTPLILWGARCVGRWKRGYAAHNIDADEVTIVAMWIFHRLDMPRFASSRGSLRGYFCKRLWWCFMAALRHGIKISSREVSSSTIDSQSGSDDAGPSVSPMEDAEEWWEHEERLAAIEEALRSADLSLREQLVLEVLYGRAEGKDVAALCGCHPSQVTRDRARIAAKLRRQMAG